MDKQYIVGIRAAASILKTQQLIRSKLPADGITVDMAIESAIMVLNAHADALERENAIGRIAPIDDGYNEDVESARNQQRVPEDERMDDPRHT